MKDFIYQHLNSKQVKKEEIGKAVRSHSQVESFTLQRLLKWPHLLMLTDNMPRCCYFRLELSLLRAKPCSLFLYGKWAFLWHQCVEFHYFRPIQNSPNCFPQATKNANYHEHSGKGESQPPSSSWHWGCHQSRTMEEIP